MRIYAPQLDKENKRDVTRKTFNIVGLINSNFKGKGPLLNWLLTVISQESNNRKEKSKVKCDIRCVCLQTL